MESQPAPCRELPGRTENRVHNGGVAEQRAQARHEWLRPGAVAVVFVGGVLGGGARETLIAIIPSGAPIPIAVLIANLLGALLLGLLLEGLIGRDTPAATRARLLLGTGFLGGFTTYSSLALAAAALAGQGEPWIALAYGLGTVVLGALATLLGLLLAAKLQGGGASDE